MQPLHPVCNTCLLGISLSSSNMASLIPPTFVPVTHFGPSDQDLASDEEWDSEIEEEIITISLDQALDTSILTSFPSFPSHSTASASGSAAQFSRSGNGPTESGPEHNAGDNLNGNSPRRTEDGPLSEAELAKSHTWSLIGLNTPTPFLKVNNTLFKGKLMERIGNEMIFGNPSTSSPPSSAAPSTLGSSTNPMLPSLQTIQFTPQTYNPTVPTEGSSTSSSYAPFSLQKKYGLSGGRPRGRPAESEKTRSGLSRSSGDVNENFQHGRDDMDEEEEDGVLTDDEDAAIEEEEDASENAGPNVYSEDEIPVEKPLPSEQTRPEGNDRNLSDWQVVDTNRSAASASTSSNRRKSRSRPRTSITNRSSSTVPDLPTDPLEPNSLEGNVLLEERQIEIGDGEAVQGFTSLVDTLSHDHDMASQPPEWSPYMSEQNGRSLDGLMGHLNESAGGQGSGLRGMIDPSLVDPSLRADSVMDQPHSLSRHSDGQQGRELLIDPSLLDQDPEHNHQSNGYSDGQQGAYMMDVDREQAEEGEANVGERLQQMHWDSD